MQRIRSDTKNINVSVTTCINSPRKNKKINARSFATALPAYKKMPVLQKMEKQYDNVNSERSNSYNSPKNVNTTKLHYSRPKVPFPRKETKRYKEMDFTEQVERVPKIFLDSMERENSNPVFALRKEINDWRAHEALTSRVDDTLTRRESSKPKNVEIEKTVTYPQNLHFSTTRCDNPTNVQQGKEEYSATTKAIQPCDDYPTIFYVKSKHSTTSCASHQVTTNCETRLNDHTTELFHADRFPTLQVSNASTDDEDTKKNSTSDKYPLDDYLFDTEFQTKRVSSPVSSVSPVLSPETLDALQNAERLVKNAQRQIIEVSFNTTLSPARENIDGNTTQPVLDDNLLYLREIVESKFQETNNPTKVHGITVENRIHLNQKLLDDQVLVKENTYVSNKDKKFEKSRCCTEEASRNSLKKLPLRDERSFFEKTYNQDQTKYPAYVDIFPDQVIRREEKVETKIFSPGHNVQDTTTGVFEVDIKDRSNMRFRVQEGPKVNIQRELTVRNIESVHISPDPSSIPVYNNVATYKFQHESFVNKTLPKSKKKLTKKLCSERIVAKSIQKNRRDLQIQCPTHYSDTNKQRGSNETDVFMKDLNLGTIDIGETGIKPKVSEDCADKLYKCVDDANSMSIRPLESLLESDKQFKNTGASTTSEYALKTVDPFKDAMECSDKPKEENIETSLNGVKKVNITECISEEQKLPNMTTESQTFVRYPCQKLLIEKGNISSNAKQEFKRQPTERDQRSQNHINHIQKQILKETMKDTTTQEPDDASLSSENIYVPSDLQEEEYNLEDISLTPPCIADLDTILRVYSKSMKQIIQGTEKLSQFLSEHTTLKVTSDHSQSSLRHNEYARNKDSLRIMPINSNEMTSLNLMIPLNRTKDQVKNEYRQSTQFDLPLDPIDIRHPIITKLEENKYVAASTSKKGNEKKNQSFQNNKNSLDHSRKQHSMQNSSVYINRALLATDTPININNLPQDVKNDYFDQDTNVSNAVNNVPTMSKHKQVVQRTRSLSTPGIISNNLQHCLDVPFPRNRELISLQAENVKLFDYSKNDETVEGLIKDRRYSNQETLPKVLTTKVLSGKGNVNLPGKFTAPLNAYLQLENVYGREMKSNIDSSYIDIHSNQNTEFDSYGYLFLHSGQKDTGKIGSENLKHKTTSTHSVFDSENKEGQVFAQVLEAMKHSSKGMQQFVLWLFDGKKRRTDDDIINVLREAAIDPITINQFISLLPKINQKTDISSQDSSKSELRLTLKDWERIYDFTKYVMDFTRKKTDMDDFDALVKSKIDEDLLYPQENCYGKQCIVSEIDNDLSIINRSNVKNVCIQSNRDTEKLNMNEGNIEIGTKLIKVCEHERENKNGAKFATSYNVFDDHNNSERMNNNTRDKAIQYEIFPKENKSMNNNQGNAKCLSTDEKDFLKCEHTNAHLFIQIVENHQDMENKIIPASSNIDDSQKLIVKEISEDLGIPMEMNSTKSTNLSISDVDSAKCIYDTEKENSVLVFSGQIDKLDSRKLISHSEIDSIILENVMPQECNERKVCYSYLESDEREPGSISTNNSKSTSPTFNKQLETLRSIHSSKSIDPKNVVHEDGTISASEQRTNEKEKRNRDLNSEHCELFATISDNLNNKEHDKSQQDLALSDSNMCSDTNADEKVLNTKPPTCMLNHDLHKNETSSETYSEGEIYLPSSCSYSLGEIRMSGQSNAVERKTFKNTDSMTIFVTRSILNLSSNASDSEAHSYGEVCEAETECVETSTEITSDGEQRQSEYSKLRKII